MKTRISVLAILLFGLFLVGCQEPPAQEITNAQKAVADAEGAEAATYAKSELEAARKALADATAEVDTQNAKFALTRNYDKAKEMLADAVTKSQAAQQAAVAGKAQAKADAEAALAAAQTAVNDARALLDSLGACKRKPKGFDKDLEAMLGRLDGLAAELSGISTSIGSEAYGDAQAAATNLSAQVATLSADMTAAKEKINC